MSRLPESPRRILVVDLACIGDLVCATPSIAALKSRYPDAEITVAASSDAAPVLFYHPDVVEVVSIDKSELRRSLKHAFQLISSEARVLRGKEFDLAILFHNSFAAALLAFLARIPCRAGYSTELRTLLLTEFVRFPRKRQHLIDQRLNLLRQLGIDASTSLPVYHADESETDATIARFLPSLSPDIPLIVLVVGSSWRTKGWPRERMDALLRKLEPGSAFVALAGGPGEEKFAEGIGSEAVEVVNIVGKTSLDELGHLLSRAAAVITPDSGPMHMAAGLRIPVIGLFGPTEPAICGMRHEKGIHIVPEIPCRCPWRKKCTADSFCMSEISEDMVLDALKPILKGSMSDEASIASQQDGG